MATKTKRAIETPSIHNWRTTDEDEINRRRWRAQTESFTISNRDARHPIFSNFHVKSGSGLTYSVEVRDLGQRQFICQCVDFRINGLGTCKHVEAVLGQLESRFRRLVKAASSGGSSRIEVVPDSSANTLRVQHRERSLPRALKPWFTADGLLRNGSPEDAVAALRELASNKLPNLRLSQEIEPWLETRHRAGERTRLRREYERKVQRGEWPAHETKVPLFPYQRDGMLHLAFTERALLADEMGLGKTIQAIAACALLHRLGQARRVLVVTPASLKTEWEEQIQRFTDLPYQLVFGARHERCRAYDKGGISTQLPALHSRSETGDGPFFTIVNYEQMLADALEVNARLQPDIIVLDEAQRIKNWSTKTTQAIKRLRSRHAFILTGTPIENRIDELYSLMDFLNPTLLGPLFRFNREYYEFDDRGRPAAYRNLHKLQERIRPYLLRRRKADVETELPERSDRNFFVPLTPQQQGEYDGHEEVAARLASIAKRRPLSQQEQDKLLRHLGMMRMTCDTNFILNPEDRSCAKLPELEKILEECRENPGVKIIVFSEWERMLMLVRDLCERLELGVAWHTGSVPQRRRRAEINTFKSDPDCRVFLSTDAGATGLNLQNAGVVINCDLPWNPAKLEQRIARAWRKHQTRPVTVINLVAENTLEHRMLETLAHKQALADGVLDRQGDLNSIKLRTGRQAFFEKLAQLGIDAAAPKSKPETLSGKPPLPVDRPIAFARAAQQRINGALVRCEERYPQTGVHSVLYVVVDRDAAQWHGRLTELHEEYFRDTDPLAPVRLEVIDRATDDAVQRLIDAGLVARTMRAARPLFPPPDDGSIPTPLSAAEREKATAHRAYAARKLKMARVLGDTGFTEETRSALLEAAHTIARALAVEHRLPEPATLDDVFLPPLSHLWNDSLAVLRGFAGDASADWNPVAAALGKRLA
ncbi:MAG: hypothetical protein QOF48_2717 [Verrucomicrobiota bacterium]|jgi:superfamily II DNA or RNA helicase